MRRLQGYTEGPSIYGNTINLNVMGFEWTDRLAMKFARVCSEGSYGNYEGCKTMESKLEVFKKLNSTEVSKESILQLTGGEFTEWYMGLDEEGKKKYREIFNELQQDYDKNKSVG